MVETEKTLEEAMAETVEREQLQEAMAGIVEREHDTWLNWELVFNLVTAGMAVMLVLWLSREQEQGGHP